VYFDPLYDPNPNHETFTKQVGIAIVDSGIDVRHPDLGGGGTPIDYCGQAYYKISASISINSGAPDVDAVGHGTSCAGIAAGWWPGEYGGVSAFETSLPEFPIPGMYIGNVFDFTTPAPNRNFWLCPPPAVFRGWREAGVGSLLYTPDNSASVWYSGG